MGGRKDRRCIGASAHGVWKDRSSECSKFPVADILSGLAAADCVKVSRRVGTPCFVLFPDLLEQLARSVGSDGASSSRLRLAYPIKTMPLAYWLRAWRKLGKYVEASSECELQLALQCGFGPKRLIVSGPGKIAWMKSLRLRNLTVVFDSFAEAQTLGPIAREFEWRVGLRFAPRHQVDPDNPVRPDQFGIDIDDWRRTLNTLSAIGVQVTMLQFHLGGWQGGTDRRLKTLRELSELVRGRGLEPEVIDVGGGLPQAYRAQEALAKARRASAILRRLEIEARRLFPSCREVIAECGRVILGPTAVLLLRIVDVKIKYGRRFIICDGGRVNHALPSDWEDHRVYFPSSGANAHRDEATICGPTCMAWDYIARTSVPIDARPGHFVVYDAAGAYHWPWQSCFSQRRAAVVSIRKLGRSRIRLQRLIAGQEINDWLSLSGV